MNPHELSFFHLAFIALVGLIIGSFINVVIVRYPKLLAQRWRKESHDFLHLPKEAEATFNLVVPRSHCVHCQHSIAWHDLVPLFSFCWLKRKCRYCHSKISWQYPLVEALNSVLLVCVALQWGLNTEAFTLMAVSEILLALAFIDLNTQLLPDDFTLSLMWLGLINSVLAPTNLSPAAAILGAAGGYALPWCINFMYRQIRKREGMGYGDFKCFAALGAWLGLEALPSLFFLAVVLGLVFSLSALSLKKIRLQQSFPFGPAIILAGWVLLMWPNEAQNYLYHLMTI